MFFFYKGAYYPNLSRSITKHSDLIYSIGDLTGFYKGLYITLNLPDKLLKQSDLIYSTDNFTGLYKGLFIILISSGQSLNRSDLIHSRGDLRIKLSIIPHHIPQQGY